MHRCEQEFAAVTLALLKAAALTDANSLALKGLASYVSPSFKTVWGQQSGILQDQLEAKVNSRVSLKGTNLII